MDKIKQKFQVAVRCMTYNHSKYITDTMNGFTMQQTTFPFVCMIVDDASSDGEQEVIKQYIEHHFDYNKEGISYNKQTEYAEIIFARHKINKNCYFAVLFLKENHYSKKKSKEPYLKEWQDEVEYIAYCEGDDYWIMPDKLQTQYNLLEKAPNAMMVYTNYQTVDEFGKVINREKYNRWKRYHKSGDILPSLFRTNFPLTCTVFVRKMVLSSDLYKNMPSRLDYGLFLTAASMGDCLYFDIESSCYRNNPDSLMNTRHDIVGISGAKIFKYFVSAYLDNRCKKESFLNNIKILYLICENTFSTKIPESRVYFISLCKHYKKLLLFVPFVIIQRIYTHTFRTMPNK